MMSMLVIYKNTCMEITIRERCEEEGDNTYKEHKDDVGVGK